MDPSKDGTSGDHGIGILDALPDAAILIDRSGNIRHVGKGTGAIFGYSPSEVLAFSTIERFLGLSFTALTGMVPNEQESVHRIVSRSGAECWVTLHVRPVPAMKGWLCILRDATLLHELDNASAFMRPNMSHAARLARQGQLLESIVHEIRQPMAAILFSARAGRNALRRLPGSGVVTRTLEIFDNIFNSVDLCLGIIDRLMRLAARGPLNRCPVDLNHILQEVVALVSIEAKARNVELHTDLAPGLASIHGDAIALQLMIRDLLMNAIEAAETNPEIGIVVARTCHDTSSASLTIHDNGPGVLPDHLPKLLEAYFTTKGAGSGLGLARPISR
jgi:PAS domain S-box-containing protein